MSENEALIDELCVELQQLSVDLEKIKVIPKKNYSEGITQDREEQSAAYSPGRNKAIRSSEQPEDEFTQEQRDNHYF